MQSLLLDARKNIIFLREPLKFSSNCLSFIERLAQLIIEKPGRKDDILKVASDIYLDLNSFMINWVLKKHIESGSLLQSSINTEANNILSFISKQGSKVMLEDIKKEADEIEHSNIKRMCEMELEGKLFTYWGHDYCTGLSHSLRRGARFVTSNPAKVNLFRKENPEIWANLVDEIKSQHNDISLEKLVSYLFLKVVAMIARDLYPIFEATDGKFGFVCIQVNPKNWKDSGKMAQEIEFWNNEFKKELNTQNLNIVYKIPAVSAAVKTVERIVRQNIRVCLTLNFSYMQHDLFSDLIEKGSQHGFVVLMSGFLDDAVEKELALLGIEDPKKYSRHAGEAVIRKSYVNLRVKACKRTSIMSAAIRGEYTIKNAITSYQDTEMYFTTMTEKILEFDSEHRELSPIIDDKVPEEIMSVLRKSTIFNAAFNKELLTLDNIDEYIPLQTVHGIFTKAYIETEESLSDQNIN